MFLVSIPDTLLWLNTLVVKAVLRVVEYVGGEDCCGLFGEANAIKCNGGRVAWEQ